MRDRFQVCSPDGPIGAAGVHKALACGNAHDIALLQLHIAHEPGHCPREIPLPQGVASSAA